MLGFILLLLIGTTLWIGLLSSTDYNEIKTNWSKYRCRPSIMPFASLYGHNTAENFNFCLMNMFGQEMGTALGPVFQILGTLLGTLMTLIQTANSVRVQFATMMGGINTMFQNFADRFKQLLSAVQMSAYRMKLIMGRLYGAFFAMIYMSIAGMTAVDNFTRTVLFDFLDTFCFDPDTPVDIRGKGIVPVKDVNVGDVFQRTGGTVTATFQFEADGQPMVRLPGEILVSTNHYVQHLGHWVQAKDHPQAVSCEPWSGGKERPLICFNTSDHTIPIGFFTFLDYDETEEADQETMQWIETRLNAKSTSKERAFAYTTTLDLTTRIRMADNSTKALQEIQLGDAVSTGRVIAVVQKLTDSVCRLPTGEWVAPGLLIWNETQWIRAGDIHPIVSLSEPQLHGSLVVLKTGMFETEDGTMIRDYVEVHSPDSEQFYSQAVERVSVSGVKAVPVS